MKANKYLSNKRRILVLALALSLHTVPAMAAIDDIPKEVAKIEIGILAGDEFSADKYKINELISNEKYGEALEAVHKLQDKQKQLYGECYEDYTVSYGKHRINGQIFLDETEDKIAKLVDEGGVENPELGECVHFNGEKAEKRNYYEAHYQLKQHILDIYKKKYDENSDKIIYAELEMGLIYDRLGYTQEALEYDLKLLPKIRKRFGKNSGDVGQLLGRIGLYHKKLGNYKDSEKYLKQAMECKGTSIPYTEAMEKFDLADTYYAEKDFANGDKLLNEAVKPFEKLDYLLPYMAEGGKKVYLAKLNSMKYAGMPLNEIINFFNKKIIGKYGSHDNLNNISSPRDIPSLMARSKIYKMMNFLSVNYDLKSVAVSNTYYAPSHYNNLEANLNLSDTYLNLNRTDDAINLARDVLDKSQKRYGETNPISLEAMFLISESYRQNGSTIPFYKTKERETVYKNALDIDKTRYDIITKKYGKDSFLAMEVSEDLSKDYLYVYDFKNFEVFAQKNIEVYKKYFGIKHAKTRKAMLELAKGYWFISNLSNSEIREKANYNQAECIDKAKKLFSQTGWENMNYLKGDEVVRLIEQSGINYLEAAEIMYILSDLNYTYGTGDDDYSKFCAQVAIAFCELIRGNRFLSDENKGQLFKRMLPIYKNHGLWADDALIYSDLTKARTLGDRYNNLIALNRTNLSVEDKSVVEYFYKWDSYYNNKIKEYRLKGYETANFMLAQNENIAIFENFKEYVKSTYPDYKSGDNSDIVNILDRMTWDSKKKILSQMDDDTVFIDLSFYGGLFISVADNNGLLKTALPMIDPVMIETYRNLLAYSSVKDMQRDNKYLWKCAINKELTVHNYQIGEGRSKPTKAYVRDVAMSRKFVPVYDSVLATDEEFKLLRTDLAKRISWHILRDIVPYVKDKKKWIISPDGLLNNIPFETFWINDEPVIKSVDISYVPSLSIMGMMKEIGEDNEKYDYRKSLLIFGAPFYGDNDYAEMRSSKAKIEKEIDDSISRGYSSSLVDLKSARWENLPGTEKEIDSVSALFEKDDVDIFKGRNAAESKLKGLNANNGLEKYKYMLFATHGLFVPSVPELSSIVLSQNVDMQEDGYVTIPEWMSCKLKSDLVYLSACESGLGDQQEGEGVVGIPYALSVAGNKDTVMSLWKVADKESAEFSVSFFAKINQGYSAVKALNDTKREFLLRGKKYSDPSVWASFVLYGI